MALTLAAHEKDIYIMARTIGFIGVGPINGTLARFAVNAGLDVIVSNSRGPDTLKDVVAELGDHARAAT